MPTSKTPMRKRRNKIPILLNINSEFTEIETILKYIMVQNKNSSPEKKDSLEAQDVETIFLDNKKSPPLEDGHYMKIGGMRNLKHEITSPKFYELLIKTELKIYTALELNNFNDHIKICLNAANIIIEDLLTDYHPTKRHSKFQ